MELKYCTSESALVAYLKRSGILEAFGFFLLREEWEVIPGHSQYGKGDMLYADGRGRFVVVEVKYLDPPGRGSSAKRRRGRKRTEVRDQALRYASIIRQAVDGAREVCAAIFTNDWLHPGLIWL